MIYKIIKKAIKSYQEENKNETKVELSLYVYNSITF